MAHLVELLRKIPSVGELLNQREISPLCAHYSRSVVKGVIREIQEEVRKGVRDGKSQPLPADWVTFIHERVERRMRKKLEAVINATGTLLHTNLGRSPLSEGVAAHLAEVATSYSSLEMDLETGERGDRNQIVSDYFQILAGSEAVVVVNNNAAALLLVLSALCCGREVIVSRGELIEIGGEFRLPDILSLSGAELVEVGTTNRTRVEDYRRAIEKEGGRGAAILKVHPSNYRIVGFTEEATLPELALVAASYEIPLLIDFGSGTLVHLKNLFCSEKDQLTVSDCLSQGADLVLFSGDKLLGGPQSGIIAGKQRYIEQIRSHPLYRALRVDKLTLAALEATLRLYLFEGEEDLQSKIPVLKMLLETKEELKTKGEKIYHDLRTAIESQKILSWKVEFVETESEVGGGTFPSQSLPSFALAIEGKEGGMAERLIATLREQSPPIIGRVKRDVVLLDLRTILPHQLGAFSRGILKALREVQNQPPDFI